jgi:hypothetical protein
VFVSNLRTTQYVCICMYLIIFKIVIHVQQAVVDVCVCACVTNRSKESRPRQLHSSSILERLQSKKKFGVIKFFLEHT